MAQIEIDMEEMVRMVLDLCSPTRTLDSAIDEILSPILPDGINFGTRNRIFASVKEATFPSWYSKKEAYCLNNFGATSSRPRLSAGRLPPRQIAGRDAASGAEVENRLDELDLSA
jgi:hypothetical protein